MPPEDYERALRALKDEAAFHIGEVEGECAGGHIIQGLAPGHTPPPVPSSFYFPLPRLH